jgi:hypothetical protein
MTFSNAPHSHASARRRLHVAVAAHSRGQFVEARPRSTYGAHLSILRAVWLSPPLLLLQLLLLLFLYASIPCGPVAVAASCNVTAPVHGSLGNCPASLLPGASCSMACSVGYAVDAAPQQTTCYINDFFFGQTCKVCSPGTTLTWDVAALAKLVGTGAEGTDVSQGRSVSLSADGSTLAAGGSADNGGIGATWVFARSGSAWSQQGTKLVGAGVVGAYVSQGGSVSLSADGSTLAVGGSADNDNAGATWVFTRTGSAWSQQGSKLVGTGALGFSSQQSGFVLQGYSVSLSADGSTLAVGGVADSGGAGATWLFTRSGSTWSQQGGKLVGAGAVGTSARQGASVSLAADGNTLAVGGNSDNDETGATWVFTRNDSTWSQQGSKLVGAGAMGTSFFQGASVSLAADGNTLAVGGDGYHDNVNAGATWVFTRNGSTWSQQGSNVAMVGTSVSLSADGNTLAVGSISGSDDAGATWLFTRIANGSAWSQQGGKLVGAGAVGTSAMQGTSVSLSADGSMLAVGGTADNGGAGATWMGTIQGSCLPCPSGYFCASGGGALPIACSAGSYCPLGSITNSTCAAGFYCADLSTQLPCPYGTWSALPGRISVTSCTSCVSGSYSSLAAQSSPAACASCPAGSFCSGGANITACSWSQYCPANSSVATHCATGQFCTDASVTADCPAGSWSSITGLTAASQCTACQAGKYGSSSGQTSAASACPFTCTAGTYGDTAGQTMASNACSTCPPGSWCAGGASVTECSAGSYSDAINLISASACTLCSIGTYGSGAGHTTKQAACPLSCAAGTYGNVSGQTTASSACVLCPAGSYCSGGANISACSPGQYCPANSSAAAAHATCWCSCGCTDSDCAGSFMSVSSCDASGTVCVAACRCVDAQTNTNICYSNASAATAAHPTANVKGSGGATDGRSQGSPSRWLLGVIFGVLGGVLLMIIAGAAGYWWHQRTRHRQQVQTHSHKPLPQLQLVQLSTVVWEGAPGEEGFRLESHSPEGTSSHALASELPVVLEAADAGSTQANSLGCVPLHTVPAASAPELGHAQMSQDRVQH